jgi:hypothetical protein
MNDTSTESSLISETILRITSQYSTYSTWVIMTAGILGNVINILIFTHLKFFRNNPCIFYLIIETISSIVYQLFSMISFILTLIYGASLIQTSLVFCRTKNFLSQTCALIVLSAICCAAGDQFFSTNYRIYLRQMCTVKCAHYLVLIFTIIWLIHGILVSILVSVNPSSGCSLSNPIWIRYATFFFYPILRGLLPVMICSVCSLLAFRNVRRIVRRQIPIQRRRLNHQITAMILLRVIVFAFIELSHSVYCIYIINITITPADSFQYAIVQLVQVIAVSLTFLNYSVRSFS